MSVATASRPLSHARKGDKGVVSHVMRVALRRREAGFISIEPQAA